MVERVLEDGVRVAELLASELTGRRAPPFDDVTVTDADPAVDPTPAGARAYDVTVAGARVASVSVTPTEARVAFCGAASGDAAESAAERVGLGLRPDAPTGRVTVAVVNGAHVKRVLAVIEAALAARA